MQRRTALTAGVVLMLTASMQPTDAFLFGILKSFFPPYPILGIKTFVEPVAIGTAYVNQSPFTTPPARKPCAAARYQSYKTPATIWSLQRSWAVTVWHQGKKLSGGIGQRHSPVYGPAPDKADCRQAEL